MILKILYITLHPNIGGGETSLFYLLEHLDRKRFLPEVVVTKKGQVSTELIKLGIKTHIIPLPGYSVRTLFIPGLSPTGVKELQSLCLKAKPNLIHINQLTLAFYAGIVGKRLKIPTVATAHGFWDSIYFYQDLISSLFIDKIIANSPKLKKTLRRRKLISSKKITAIPFGIDTKRFTAGSKSEARKTLSLPKDKLLITVVGRIDPQKDYLNFFRAAKIIAMNLPNANFYLVGSKLGDFSGTDYSDKINKYLNQNPKLNKGIIWAGFVKQMPLVYNASDILVMASTFEGLPLTLFEAASSSLPVVATKTGSVDLVVKNGKTGFLVPPQNPKKLAEKVIELGKTKKLREGFGKRGRKHIVKNFPIEKYVKEVERVYLSLLQLNSYKHTKKVVKRR